jgi:hypothetical protein
MSATSSQDAVARATRHPVRGHRGISYRERADGSRTYFVFFDGQYRRAGKTLQEALTMQGDLRAKKGRGERTGRTRWLLRPSAPLVTTASAHDQDPRRREPGSS